MFYFFNQKRKKKVPIFLITLNAHKYLEVFFKRMNSCQRGYPEVRGSA